MSARWPGSSDRGTCPRTCSGCSAAGSGTKESSGFDCPCVALSSPFIGRSGSGGIRLASTRIRGTAMERDDGQIASVLRELADLSLRMGERAGELARLTAERRPARRSRSSESRTPEKASTNPRKQTSPTPRSSRRQPALQAAVQAAVKEGRGIRLRPPVGQRFLPKRRLDGRRRLLHVGPGLTSFGVHLIALLGLAMMYVKVKAEPARVAITLGEAVELGEPAENVADEITLVAFDGPQQPDDSMESLAVAEAIAVEPLPDAVSSSEELFADVQSADAAGATDAALFDSGDMLAEIAGDGQRGEGQGGGGQRGGGEGAGGAADRNAPTFFGRTGQGRSVCFICDNSNSYRDGSFHAVLDELSRAVDLLRPDQSFFVIFSSDAAYPLFHPAGADALQPATVENKQKLRAWLGTVEMCSGGQGIHDAVRLAGALGADCVYLLSDGEIGANVVGRLEAADFGGAVVHTFGVQLSVIGQRTGQVDPDRLREQQGRNQNLITVATAHGGTFTAVAVPAAVAALERLRPIPRNRSRGAVWGVKL